VIYASVVSEDSSARDRLESAVSTFLAAADPVATSLWRLSYRMIGPNPVAPDQRLHKPSPQVMLFAPRTCDIAFDDGILTGVKEAWEEILGIETAAQSTFLRFEERESEGED
jgi:hypothetical protein